MKINQRSAPSSSARTSHFNIAQNTTAVHKEDMAYTSDSTAENQNVSEKAYANAPTKPAPITTIVCVEVREVVRFALPRNILRPKAVIDQNKKRIVNPELTAEPTFIQYASCDLSPIAIFENMFWIIKNKGAPG